MKYVPKHKLPLAEEMEEKNPTKHIQTSAQTVV